MFFYICFNVLIVIVILNMRLHQEICWCDFSLQGHRTAVSVVMNHKGLITTFYISFESSTFCWWGWTERLWIGSWCWVIPCLTSWWQCLPPSGMCVWGSEMLCDSLCVWRMQVCFITGVKWLYVHIDPQQLTVKHTDSQITAISLKQLNLKSLHRRTLTVVWFVFLV